MVGLEGKIGEMLRQKGLTLGVVESATGGLISHLITGVPGVEKVAATLILSGVTSFHGYDGEGK